MKERVEELIRQGGVALAFDTNALWQHKKLFEVCNLANQLRGKSSHRGFDLLVPAVAHCEHVLHIRHETGAKTRSFSSEVLREGLERKGLRVEGFLLDDAEKVAELIAGNHPSAESWQQAKKELAFRRSGLTDQQKAELPGKKFAATVDWLIAGQAAGNAWILVTNDTGPEFGEVPLKIDFDSLEAILLDLLAEHPAAP